MKNYEKKNLYVIKVYHLENDMIHFMKNYNSNLSGNNNQTDHNNI